MSHAWIRKSLLKPECYSDLDLLSLADNSFLKFGDGNIS